MQNRLSTTRRNSEFLLAVMKQHGPLSRDELVARTGLPPEEMSRSLRSLRKFKVIRCLGADVRCGRFEPTGTPLGPARAPSLRDVPPEPDFAALLAAWGIALPTIPVHYPSHFVTSLTAEDVLE